MNEDKEKTATEVKIESYLYDSDHTLTENQQRHLKEFIKETISQSNKALLTKLRGEIEIERIHKPELIPTNPDYYESEEYFRHEVKRDENNRILDINIALIDKYLE